MFMLLSINCSLHLPTARAASAADSLLPTFPRTEQVVHVQKYYRVQEKTFFASTKEVMFYSAFFCLLTARR